MVAGFWSLVAGRINGVRVDWFSIDSDPIDLDLASYQQPATSYRSQASYQQPATSYRSQASHQQPATIFHSCPASPPSAPPRSSASAATARSRWAAMGR